MYAGISPSSTEEQEGQLLHTLEGQPAKPPRRKPPGRLSKKQFAQIDAEVAAEMAEYHEQDRLYREQQTANGNPPKIWSLPPIHEDPYASHDTRPTYQIIQDNERLNLCDTLEQWDVARYLIRHGTFTSRKALNTSFGKPPHSQWARQMLELLVRQRALTNTGSIELDQIMADGYMSASTRGSKRNAVK